MGNGVPNRSSEGISAQLFPRTDFPQQGWIRKPTGSLFEYRIQSWHIPTVRTPEGVRLREKRLSYTDFPQQGWIRTATGNLFEYRIQSWPVRSERTNPGRRYWPDTNQQPAWIFSTISGGPAYNPAQNVWQQAPELIKGRSKALFYLQRSFQVSRLQDELVAPSWQELSGSFASTRRIFDGRYYQTLPQDGWITANTPVVGFDPSQMDWHIKTSRTGPGARYQRDTNHDDGWITSNVPVVIFDPSTMDWYINTALAPTRKPYRLDTAPDVGWLTANLPGAVFDPSTMDWHIDTVRTAPGPRYYRHTPPDTSWIYTNLPVPFDAALFAGIAQLSGDRTKAAQRIETRLQQFFYDYGWLHDVIPLTDPPPGAAVIIVRPIAPIMAARRRNRRR